MSEQIPNHEQLEGVQFAIDTLASEFHEDWRNTRLDEDTGNFEPRVKATTDTEWIQSHGTDQVDIANSTYDELPADWQAENKAAAEVVVDVMLQHDGKIDLSDPAVRSEVGGTVHDAWMLRNEWAKGGELDVPFDQLPSDEQAKDIDQVTVAQRVFGTQASDNLIKMSERLSPRLENPDVEPESGEIGFTIVPVGGQTEDSPSVEAISHFENNHFVKEAPLLSELPNTVNSTDTIQTWISGTLKTMSEKEAVEELVDFLHTMTKQSTDGEAPSEDIPTQAQQMLDSLAFIGSQERKEAVAFIGLSWKKYLRDDANRQICTITGIKNMPKASDMYEIMPEVVKSDRYLLDNILATFSDEELEEFAGRIVTNIGDLTADPDNVRVILLDDWIMSGKQIQSLYSKNFLYDRVTDQSEKYAGCAEIQLIAADDSKLEHGFKTSKNGERVSVPVSAYFKVPSAIDRQSSYREEAMTSVTGAHSSVDYGFSVNIGKWIRDLEKTGLHFDKPALASVAGGYRGSDLRNIKRLEEHSNKS